VTKGGGISLAGFTRYSVNWHYSTQLVF